MPTEGGDERGRALALAHRALAARDRTCREMRSWLERRGIGTEAAEHAVGELLRAGLLDDVRFARGFAGDKRELERWGSDRIERELLRRGVEPAVVAGVAAATGREDELAGALALLAERVPPPSDDRERDRAWRLLVRKGYEPELAYDAVRAHGADRAA